jgi:hypothetical protein
LQVCCTLQPTMGFATFPARLSTVDPPRHRPAPTPGCHGCAPAHRCGSERRGVATVASGLPDGPVVLGVAAPASPAARGLGRRMRPSLPPRRVPVGSLLPICQLLDAVDRGGGPAAHRLAFLVTHHPSECSPRRQPRRVTAALASSPFYRSAPDPAQHCCCARVGNRWSSTSRPCSTDESVASHRVAAPRRPILPWACVILRGPPGRLARRPKAAGLPAEAGSTFCCLVCRRTGSAPRASGLCGRLSASRSAEALSRGLSTPAVPIGSGSPGRPAAANVPTPKRREARFPTVCSAATEPATEMARCSDPTVASGGNLGSWRLPTGPRTASPNDRPTRRPEVYRATRGPVGSRARRLQRHRRTRQASLCPARCSVPAPEPRSRRSVAPTRGGKVCPVRAPAVGASTHEEPTGRRGAPDGRPPYPEKAF